MNGRRMFLGSVLMLVAATADAGPLGPNKASQAVTMRGTTTSSLCEPGDKEFTTRNPNQTLDILPGQVLVLTGLNAQISVSPPPPSTNTYVLRLYERLSGGENYLSFVPVTVGPSGSGAVNTSFPPIVVTTGFTACADVWAPTAGVTLSFATAYGFIAADK